MDFQGIIFTVPARKRAPDVPDSAPASNVLHSYFIFDASQRPTAADMEQALAPVAMAAAPVSVPEQIESPRVQIDRLTVERRWRFLIRHGGRRNRECNCGRRQTASLFASRS